MTEKEFNDLISNTTLKQKIGQMIMIGFEGPEVTTESPIVQDIKNNGLGGVILFNVDMIKGNPVKNIVNKAQLTKLTSDLQNYSPLPLFISIDQEGGKVERLNATNGFQHFLSAYEIGLKNDTSFTREWASSISKTLKEVNININFAPVVDLNINPKNPIIYKLNRSFSEFPKDVSKHALAFLEISHKYSILGSIKHFPGHGSSLNDSHQGFTDITDTWTENEIVPFQDLSNYSDFVLVGHLIHRKFDAQYPASLSKEMIGNMLIKNLGFKGLVITDAMDMKAIIDNYGFNESIVLAVNAGVDILLFSNNFRGMPLDLKMVENIQSLIIECVKNGTIKEDTINNAFNKIVNAKHKLIESSFWKFLGFNLLTYIFLAFILV